MIAIASGNGRVFRFLLFALTLLAAERWRMAVAKPEITIAHVEELFADEVGQLWSPATVLINWPPVAGLRSPAIEVRVIALARADMTLHELNRAHLQAAHDVLNAAVLGLEQMTEIPSPSRQKPLRRS
jgi:hypothetical protein